MSFKGDHAFRLSEDIKSIPFDCLVVIFTPVECFATEFSDRIEKNLLCKCTLLQFIGDHLVVIFTPIECFAMGFSDRIEKQSFNLLCKCTLLELCGDHLVVIFTPVECFAMESSDRIEKQSFKFLCKNTSCEFSLLCSAVGQLVQISILGQISI
jgi:hypothetical protein